MYSIFFCEKKPKDFFGGLDRLGQILLPFRDAF